MDFNILTLGCKVNQYESQAMREDLLRHGYVPSKDKEHADITKLIHRVRRENPEGIVVLTGCMPQAFPEEMERFTECDIILGNKERAKLIPAIERFCVERNRLLDIPVHQNQGALFESMTVSAFSEHTRAFIKIEDGCNRFCSYCIIPYARLCWSVSIFPPTVRVKTLTLRTRSRRLVRSRVSPACVSALSSRSR